MAYLRITSERLCPLRIEVADGKVSAIHWERRRGGPDGLFGEQAEQRLLKKIQRDLIAYFKGKPVAFDWPLDWDQGTPFQRKVWHALTKIPYGTTKSYEWLAKKVGNPLAVRAVGSANGKNPFSIIVPCHRVIRKSGQLGGYAGGLNVKEQLLALEHVEVS